MKTIRQKRGVTLIEGMAAATILVTGMTGITAMLIRGAGLSGDSAKALKAAGLANQHLTGFTQSGYTMLAEQIPAGSTLPVAVFVPQYSTDLAPTTAGDTIYAMDASIQQITTDGGVGVVQVIVSAQYRDWARRDRIISMSGIVSEKPDASF